MDTRAYKARVVRLHDKLPNKLTYEALLFRLYDKELNTLIYKALLVL